MNDELLLSALETVCMEDYVCTRPVPVHHFSRRHRKAMERILYPNSEVLAASGQIRFSRRTLIILIAAVFLAAFITGAALVSFINGFAGRVHHDNTQFYGEFSGSQLDTIQEVYSLTEIPEGYYLSEEVQEQHQYYVTYQNVNDDSDSFMFTQNIKSYFDMHMTTDDYITEKITVNGNEGFYINWGTVEEPDGGIYWIDDNYAFSILGNFDKEEMQKLAESAKVL